MLCSFALFFPCECLLNIYFCESFSYIISVRPSRLTLAHTHTHSLSHACVLPVTFSRVRLSRHSLAHTTLSHPHTFFDHSFAALGSVIVEVEADDGTVGVGVSIGGEPACFIVENHLSRFVEGQDPR